MKKGVVIAVAAALAIAVGVGGFVLLRAPQTAAQAYAEDVAGSLAEGRVPASTDAPDDAQDRLDLTLRGMGDLPHAVRVFDVTLDDDERTGRITFQHSWTIHADKQRWTYRTLMPISRRDGEWVGSWSNAVLEPTLKDTERLGATRVEAERGDILGDGGAPLVTQRAVARIGISRPHTASVEQAQDSARRLAELLGIDVERYVAAVGASGPQAFVEAITYRDPSPELERVARPIDGIPGATSVVDVRPLAPTSTFAAPILGRAGEATAEVIAASGGRIRAGQVVGISGLQADQDQRLSGTAGFVVEAISGEVGPARRLFGVPPTHGQDVQTTLDPRLQTIAEGALQEIEPASAVVAIRPSDGHVLAAASGPGSQGYSTATLGEYAPGSTFKAVTALALLRAGATPETRLECTATTNVDGRSFKNYDDYPAARLGDIPLGEVIANSCNTGLIAARDRLAPEALAGAAEALGLPATPALGVPASLGSVPETEGETDLAASVIGQGRIVTTPLGMATVAASIGAGHPVHPVLVTTPQQRAEPGVESSPVSPAEAQQLRTMMRGVVTDGSATFLQQVPGPPVLAKTGTAEYGADTPPRTHAWMIAVQGDLAVAVFVEDGAGGARTAGPILQRFLTEAQQG